jgi:hypothetical protein
MTAFCPHAAASIPPLGSMAMQNSNAVAITGGSIANISPPIAVLSGGTGADNQPAARANLGLTIGAQVQAWSAVLDALALKTVPSGALVGTTDAQTLTNKTISASLNTISGLTTAMFAANVVDTDATLAANSATRLPAQSAVKSYVDNAVSGLKWKASALAATTANITLSAAQTIDGVSVVAGDRVLVKNQTTQTQNGIYVVAAGAWARSTDADTATELLQATLFIQDGTVNADTQWTCTNNTITVGVTNLVFAQVSGAGTYSAGAGLGLTGNQFSVTDAELVALMGLTSGADLAPIFTGSGTATTYTVTTAARTVLDDTTVAAMLATLGGYPAAGGNLTGLATQSGGQGLVLGNTSLFTSIFAGGAIAPILQVQVAGAAGAMVGRWGASASGPGLHFVKSRGATVGTHGALLTNDQLGALGWAGSDGTAMRDGPRLIASVTAAPTATLCPSRIDLISNDGTTSFVGIGQSPTGDLQVNQANVITQARHIQLRSYTAGTLPSAATAGQLIYVSDGAGGLREAVSDGTTWRLPNGQDAAQGAINAQVGTTYTLLLADMYRTVEMNNAAANTLTVPLNATAAFPIGTTIDIVQTGAGKTTLAAAGGVTLNSTGGLLSIAAQWSRATLQKRATDTWVLTGALIA